MRRKGFRFLAGKWDVFPFSGLQGGSLENIDSIFFSDFSNRIRAKDIFELFDCDGTWLRW